MQQASASTRHSFAPHVILPGFGAGGRRGLSVRRRVRITGVGRVARLRIEARGVAGAGAGIHRERRSSVVVSSGMGGCGSIEVFASTGDEGEDGRDERDDGGGSS